jgi:hypothetical protein
MIDVERINHLARELAHLQADLNTEVALLDVTTEDLSVFFGLNCAVSLIEEAGKAIDFAVEAAGKEKQ